MLKHRRKTTRRKTGGAGVELEKVTLGREALPEMQITIIDRISVCTPSCPLKAVFEEKLLPSIIVFIISQQHHQQMWYIPVGSGFEDLDLREERLLPSSSLSLPFPFINLITCKHDDYFRFYVSDNDNGGDDDDDCMPHPHHWPHKM